MALYDLTSSYFEGTACPLARFGHNRDGKKGKLQVNYGLLTNGAGIPASVSVFEGNAGDPKTLLPAVRRVREQFGVAEFTIVGEGGMITQTRIEELRPIQGLDWITALRPEGIARLFPDGAVQMGLFDQRHLFELTHPDFPGERPGLGPTSKATGPIGLRGLSCYHHATGRAAPLPLPHRPTAMPSAGRTKSRR